MTETNAVLLSELLRNELRGLHPDDGERLVRAVLYAEPSASLDVVASLPSFINIGVRALTDLGAQVLEKSTPALTKELLRSLGDDVDRDALEVCWQTWRPVLRRLWQDFPEVRERLLEQAARHGAALVAAGVNSAAGQIAGRAPRSRHLRCFIDETRRQLDRAALSEAGFVIAEDLIARKRTFLTWSVHLLARRVGTR